MFSLLNGTAKPAALAGLIALGLALGSGLAAAPASANYPGSRSVPDNYSVPPGAIKYRVPQRSFGTIRGSSADALRECRTKAQAEHSHYATKYRGKFQSKMWVVRNWGQWRAHECFVAIWGYYYAN